LQAERDHLQAALLLPGVVQAGKCVFAL
jgi:hypothetical protein